MSTTTAPTPQSMSKGTTAKPSPERWWRVAGWPLAGAGLAMGWLGGAMGVAGGALALLGAWLLFQRGAPGSPDAGAPTAKATTANSTANSTAALGAGRQGAEVMVAQVVPVWSRQMEVTRDVATEGLGNILNVFSEMSGSLQTLTTTLETFSVAAQPGAVDDAVRGESPALQALLSASERAFEQRDVAVAELGRCADALGQLQQLAKQAREIARHTRLVAFNASIEANRSQQRTDGGSQAVASEVRMLATRMAETGERIESVILNLGSAIQKARRNGEIGDTSTEELRLELDLRARQALTGLLAAVGGSLQGSADVKQASAALSDQLEQVFVHFQFGDRVSQMLNIVGNDMTNFAQWVAEHPRATQSDAAAWLTALEESYTMEEQRSHHHGNVHIERSAAVEFF